MANTATVFSREVYEKTVARILHRVDFSEGHEGGNDDGTTTLHHADGVNAHEATVTGSLHQQQCGPLTLQELSELSVLCSAAQAAEDNKQSRRRDLPVPNSEPSDCGFAAVEVDQLLGLLSLLNRHVNLAVAVSLIESAASVVASGSTGRSPSQVAAALDKWLTQGDGNEKVAKLRAGLEAAAIILHIVNTPGIDRRAIHEDYVTTTITLVRLHIAKHLVPAFNSNGHFTTSRPTATTSSTREGSPDKKRRLSAGGINDVLTALSVAGRDLRSVYKQLIGTVTLQLVLMSRLEDLVKSLSLNDQDVLLITNGCLVAFEIDCNAVGADSRPSKTCFPQHLQTASIGVVTAAFRKYPAHRSIILEDLFPLMLKLPVAKRSLRSYPVRYSSSPSKCLEAVNTKLVGPFISNASQPHCIQMITALLFSMVHASVTRPIVNPSVGEDHSDNAKEQTGAMGYISGLGTCQVIASAFVSQMLLHCKNKASGGSEYRQLLSNIVDDLLLTVMIPEYPAAEIILSTIQQWLNRDLQQVKNVRNGNQQPLEVTYLNFVFDLMGKMCATQARFVAAARERPIELTTDVPMSISSTDEQEVACYCQRKSRDVLLIQCDRCNKLYHGPCVGISAKENAPDEWFCDSCCLGKIVAEKLGNLPETEAAYLDKMYAMYGSFLSTTASRLVVGSEDVLKIHLGRWFDELERKWSSGASSRRPVQILAQMSELWDNPVWETEALSDEGGIRVIIGVMVSTLPFLMNFKSQVGFILKVMSDESAHSLRKSSLKVIEKCVEGDQNLMLLPILRASVSKRIADESISVREAAVSLVGKYVAQCPWAIESYQAALVPCLEDSGVSVRKRAIRIFQIILGDNPGFRGRATVYDLMLRRCADPKEEDGVRDLIHEVFSVLWLRESAKSVSGAHQPLVERSERVSSRQGFVTPDTPVANCIRKEPELAAVQMVEVVRAAGTGAHLEALLKKLLSGGIDSDSERKQLERQKRRQLGLKQCMRLADSLFEYIVDIEEMRNIREHVGKDLAATLATIAVFANVVPTPVMSRVETVVLYLRGDNKVSKEDETAIVCASCDVLFRLSSAFESHVISKLARGTLAKDLARISFTYGPAALASTIRAFAALSNHPVDSGESLFSQKLLGVAEKFYGFAVQSITINDFSSSNSSEGMAIQKVHRSLTALGLICEYREVSFDSSAWEMEIKSESIPQLIGEKITWDNFTLACYRLFWLYLLKEDLATKCKALSALKGIFVSQPQLLLMMDHIGLFDMVMSDDVGVPLQLEALACWQSILEAEELRIDSGKAESMMDKDGDITLSKRISGDQNGDATLFGGVLTNHAERLFAMTQSPNKSVRLATLRLVGLLLRQGLVNPNDAVPHLFALQGDVDNEPIRSMALSLLITEGEKRPEVLRQRIRPGVKQAYTFQRTIYPSKTDVSALVSATSGGHVECIFGAVFEECILKNQKHRLGLYRSLLSLFELEGLGGGRDSKAASHDLPLLSFAAQVLAHLPYTAAVDPLFIVHHVDILYTSQGIQIMDRFVDFLREHGIYGEDEFEGDIYTEDVLEKAAKSKFPSRTAVARRFCSKSFPIITFLEFVREGAVVMLLLRLKKFLCTGYNLSVARCLEYDPNSKERLCDKNIPKVKFSEPFDASVSTLVQVDGTVDEDALIREYAAIRRHVRNEGTAEIPAAEDGDENRKSVASSRKRTKSDGDQQSTSSY